MAHKSACLLLTLLLASCASPPADNRQTADFRGFVRDFFADPEFQKQHIRFPLVTVSLCYNDDTADLEPVVDQLSASHWVFMPGPDVYRCENDCFDIVIYDSFARRHRDSGERVLSFEGAGNGINSALYFAWQDQRWQLVRFEQLDDLQPGTADDGHGATECRSPFWQQ